MNAPVIRSYRLTTIRSSMGRMSERTFGIRMLGRPVVGRPMVMYGSDGNRRIVTSRVTRMFDDMQRRGTYVETANTLYLLQS